MLIDERFILLFLDCYLIRTIAHNGNNFQWKINVAMRSFAVFSCTALLCSGRLLLLLHLPSDRLEMEIDSNRNSFQWKGVLTVF